MKSSRNKTITVQSGDSSKYPLLRFDPKKKNKIFFGDALQELKKVPDKSVDLIITDPPYTIRKNFGKGTVSTKETQFTLWCADWIEQCHRVLKKNGSIYICINWEASNIVEYLLKQQFTVRNRITWQRDKGRGAKKNWKNNLEDIWFATKSDKYTFNLDDVKIEKQVIAPYVDKEGQPKDWKEKNGKKYRLTHPSNIWTDLVVPFWSMPENTEHPTQKPEKLIERIIKASSNKGDLILDPFMGSGTTAVVAQKLKRDFIGFEIEKKYYTLANKRLALLDKKID
jgi:site-specific DNA-methyltransferase (adenine-specific)